MKKYSVLLLVVGFLLTSFAILNPNNQKANKETVKAEDEAGIQFKSIAFKDALELAKKEKKIIFIDAYTNWCGPCKMMARTTFKDKGVGEFFNKNFINLKIEMEKDADGPEIFRRYSVTAYPTFLFVDANGKLVNRLLGYMQPSDFLPRVKAAVNKN